MLFSPVVRFQPFSKPFPPDCELHTCFSIIPPLRWDRMATMGWSWIFLILPVELCISLPPGQLGMIFKNWGKKKIQQVRIWLNSFS